MQFILFPRQSRLAPYDQTISATSTEKCYKTFATHFEESGVRFGWQRLCDRKDAVFSVSKFLNMISCVHCIQATLALYLVLYAWKKFNSLNKKKPSHFFSQFPVYLKNYVHQVFYEWSWMLTNILKTHIKNPRLSFHI